jgi:acyl carrier protein phosphodiesterase
VNFLAHFHLAWPDEGLLIGGLEGDYIKGPLRGALLPQIERGIRLHRAIDAYTDGHPLIQQLRRDLPPGLRRYAGILIDLSFDHYLSRHWSTYASIPLEQFSRGVYRTLSDHEWVLSEGARMMSGRLLKFDLLNLYSDWDTVLTTATRIGQRFRHHNPFLHIDQELSPAQGMLEQAFLNFYPQLQAFCQQQVGVLQSSARLDPLH